MASGLFSIPVDGQAEPVELVPHLVDIAVSPFTGVNIAFDGSIFGRQSEGVPAHWMQDRIPPHALNTRDHISDHVVPYVTHVQAS